jgi:hypothetical protein
MVTVTRELIAQGSCKGAGWSILQLRALGAWPARRGWQRRIIGQQISAARAEAFLAGARRDGDTRAKRKARVMAVLRQAETKPREVISAETADLPEARKPAALSARDGDTACPICAGSGVDPRGRSCDLCPPF